MGQFMKYIITQPDWNRRRYIDAEGFAFFFAGAQELFDLEKIDLMRYFKGIDAGKYRGAVLGCTHYIYLKERLKKSFVPPSFVLISTCAPE